MQKIESLQRRALLLHLKLPGQVLPRSTQPIRPSSAVLCASQFQLRVSHRAPRANPGHLFHDVSGGRAFDS